MKRMLYYFSLFTALSVVLSSCEGFLQSPPATKAPIAAPSATLAPPTATEAPATQPAVLQPIDLAGPPMEVGSRYMYVDGAILVAVPGGPFLMGSKYFGDTEHKVTVSDFWIYSTKVTNGQYARCLEAGQCTSPDLKNNKPFSIARDINLPVTGVNYAQGEAYCKFVHARLPTEAEWEKTARGPDGNLFPWGNGAPVCDLLNFNFCKSKTTDVTDYPTGVSYYSALDMSGNAREWVADWFDLKYYDASPDTDPLGPQLGEKRSVRGSSYQDSADPSISAHRYSLKPTENLPDLSFRCVVEDPTYYAPYCKSLALFGANPNGGPTDAVIPLGADCEQPSLTITSTCPTNGQPTVTIKGHPDPLPAGDTFTGDTPADPAPAGCQLSYQQQNGAPIYTCTSGSGLVKIDVSGQQDKCKVDSSSNQADCGPGDYVLDGSTGYCVGKGPGVNCPTGFNYDPAAQCCSAQNPGAKSVCPPGFLPQSNGCTADNPGSQLPPDGVVQSFDVQSACEKFGIRIPEGGVPGVCEPKSCKGSTDPRCVEVTCP